MGIMREEEEAIESTVKRLPVEALFSLLKFLHEFMVGKNLQSLSCVKWLRIILSLHSSYLMSNPDIETLLIPLYNILQHRSELYSSASSLRGRLDLLVGQITSHSDVINTEPLLLYKDESSDSEDDMMMESKGPSDSDIDFDNWDTFSNDEDNPDDKIDDLDDDHSDDDENSM